MSTALTVTAEDISGRDSRYNITPYDLLLKIPDITLKNVRLILEKVENMKDFSELTVDQLSDILDNRKYAENIIKFINKEYVLEVSDQNQSVQVSKQKSNARQKRTKAKS